MKTMFVKPAKEGLKVRDPKGGHLPAEGAEVPCNPYWNRRLRDGDVVKASKPKPSKSDSKS